MFFTRVIIFRNLVLQIEEKEMNQRKREILQSQISSLLAGEINNDETMLDDTDENENENKDTVIEISQLSSTGQAVRHEEQEEINNDDGQISQSSMNQIELLREIQAQAQGEANATVNTNANTQGGVKEKETNSVGALSRAATDVNAF